MKRLDALDIARFLAFCGMVLVNFRVAAQVEPGLDLINALEGSAAALFVVLAGICRAFGLEHAQPVWRSGRC